MFTEVLKGEFGDFVAALHYAYVHIFLIIRKA